MPFVSEAQERFVNAHRKKLEAQGMDVDEWNQASKGAKLPERAPSSEEKKKPPLPPQSRR